MNSIQTIYLSKELQLIYISKQYIMLKLLDK